MLTEWCHFLKSSNSEPITCPNVERFELEIERVNAGRHFEVHRENPMVESPGESTDLLVGLELVEPEGIDRCKFSTLSNSVESRHL
jgi:hypothetical protein